jgi:uncharacterized membrane protein YidH (DUF202 family)
MKKYFWACLTLLGAGLVVLSWPEESNMMLVKFSETHGPSRLDSIGLLLIMTGYLPMIFMVAKRFKNISRQRGKTKPVVLAIISVLALIMIAIALNLSNDVVLWISVAISTASQSLLLYDAFARDKLLV